MKVTAHFLLPEYSLRNLKFMELCFVTIERTNNGLCTQKKHKPANPPSCAAQTVGLLLPP